MLKKTKNKLTSTTKFTERLDDYIASYDDVAIFDQNGYDMCPVELQYAIKHKLLPSNHRASHIALRYEWMSQEDVTDGAHINHCNLFERKGYDAAAKEQLIEWSTTNALIWKIIKIRPKWGLDFSIDYADHDGNVFEVLHWEWDSFDYQEVLDKQEKYEPFLLSTDWNDAAKELLKRKDEWHHLGFFEQSDWKCKYFGIEPEQFKMVLWD